MSGANARRVRVAELLLDLEAALRNAQLWEASAPSAAALASTEPFCIDTLNFIQWLQHVFLPRMHMLLHSGAELPQKCGMAEMAELYFSASSSNGSAVIATLREIDQIIEVAAQPGH